MTWPADHPIVMLMEWAAAERERMGFVWLGTCEADPRTPGPPMLAWARSARGALWVRLVDADAPAVGWTPCEEDEWAKLWPHAPVPPRLPSGPGGTVAP